MPKKLLVRVSFPRAAYCGSADRAPEQVPSPARLHAAFVAAAAGGPFATAEGPRLVAGDHHRAAVCWLEENEPLAIIEPATWLTVHSVRRHRFRAAVNHRTETAFEPLCALAGPVTYVWSTAPSEVMRGLCELAPEITHVGSADSTAIVKVELGDPELDVLGARVRAEGRGPGRIARVAAPGRMSALEEAHLAAMGRGGHTAGSRGRQAEDHPVPNAGDRATVSRRFVERHTAGQWPFAEAWRVALHGRLPPWALRRDRRIALAVAIHRAVVAAIGADVPTFVTGRDGVGPLRGSGHLAIQLLVHRAPPQLELILGVPAGVPEADRGALLRVLVAGLRVRLGNRAIRVATPQIGSALWFWPEEAAWFTTAVPMVLDASGRPRRGPWSLDDAVICSVGFALRGVLEAAGTRWGTGWAFRQRLVAELKQRGVEARGRRVAASASSYVHRAAPGDLLVAAEAMVTLGDLAPTGRGLLALGRARHLGGGLLRPVTEGAP